MAFPVYQAAQTGSNASATTSHTVNLPSSIVAGEKLIIAFGTQDSTNSVVTPSGWTRVGAQTFLTGTLNVFTKVATGAEGSSITITTSGSTESIYISYRVYSNNDPVTGTFNSDAADATPDPAAHNPGTTDEYLWMTFILVPDSINGGVGTITGYPSNFTDNQIIHGVDGGTLDMRIGSATVSSEASSITPSNWTLNTATNTAMATIAIEGQDVEVATFNLLESNSNIFQPAVDFAANANFNLIESNSQIFAPTTKVSTNTVWQNEAKPSNLNWNNDTL